MRIELELWQFITLLCSVIGAFWALAKVIALQAKADIKQQFEGMGKAIQAQSEELRSQGEGMRRLERELLEHKTHVARETVHREDFTRVISSFTVQVDHLRLTIERFMLEGRKRD